MRSKAEANAILDAYLDDERQDEGMRRAYKELFLELPAIPPREVCGCSRCMREVKKDEEALVELYDQERAAK